MNLGLLLEGDFIDLKTCAQKQAAFKTAFGEIKRRVSEETAELDHVTRLRDDEKRFTEFASKIDLI